VSEKEPTCGCGCFSAHDDCLYPALLKAAEAALTDVRVLGLHPGADCTIDGNICEICEEVADPLRREVERAKEAFFRTLAGEGGDVKDAKA
jgi:hypothetical protein